jgi:hypothetical protein
VLTFEHIVGFGGTHADFSCMQMAQPLYAGQGSEVCQMSTAYVIDSQSRCFTLRSAFVRRVHEDRFETSYHGNHFRVSGGAPAHRCCGRFLVRDKSRPYLLQTQSTKMSPKSNGRLSICLLDVTKLRVTENLSSEYFSKASHRSLVGLRHREDGAEQTRFLPSIPTL